jgi:glycosyltransferase involved in cell wall biosynthesis
VAIPESDGSYQTDDTPIGLPLVSVIVATYRRPELLARQLASLARQDVAASWEVIVADNGRDDRTRAVVERFRGRVPGIRWIDASMGNGSPGARNAGARAARGDLLLFLDDDDEADPALVRVLVDALRQHDFVAARLEHDLLNTNWVARALVPWQTERLMETSGFLTHANGCALGIRRDLFDRAGGWQGDVRHLDDVFFCWAVQLSGGTLHLVEGAVLHYRHRSSAFRYFTQEWRSGLGDIALYERFGPHGMPFPTPGLGQKSSGAFVVDLFHCHNPGEMLVWAGALVRRISRVVAIRAYHRKGGR